jgi:carbonic anhydrase/acetyltransferase-like protein (isoleucine patch superfamily)
VKIGGVSNVQDHAVITTVSALESGFPAKVDIGNYVTIGAETPHVHGWTW